MALSAIVEKSITLELANFGNLDGALIVSVTNTEGPTVGELKFVLLCPLIGGAGQLAHLKHGNMAWKATAAADPDPFAGLVTAAAIIAAADFSYAIDLTDSNAGSEVAVNTEVIPMVTVGQRLWTIAWFDDVP